MKRKTVKVSMPKMQLAVLGAISKLAGVSMNDTTCVLLAYAMVRIKMGTDKVPPPKVPR